MRGQEKAGRKQKTPGRGGKSIWHGKRGKGSQVLGILGSTFSMGLGSRAEREKLSSIIVKIRWSGIEGTWQDVEFGGKGGEWV